ncbi:IMP cyclohydrolase [Haladaptatus pallidirubidus]|uniref:IMP cyclohydrolase n=1 Tax=Haladaptatus pallidirubidus TaxID=1008152 RepID=A0AAV3UGI4_9EURY|nr:IMP cyclohydrolase [Haladaptatus pallidirubidus]
MYIGRFIVIGPDVGAYRVSSRSFPNRKAVARDDAVTIAPTEDAPETDNPYISYNCARIVGDAAVIGNGSQVDPIAEKIELGYPVRDALAETLLALDYEKDDYDTPRIAGTIGEESYIGIVRRDALLIEQVTEPALVATYEKNTPEPFAFRVESAEEAAIAAYELDFEHPVCSVGVARNGRDASDVEGDASDSDASDTFSFAIKNGN